MNKHELAKLVLSYCSRNFYGRSPFDLFGPGNKPARVAIIHAATGKKPKSSECGVTRLTEVLLDRFPVTSASCLANQEYQLRQLIQDAAANP